MNEPMTVQDILDGQPPQMRRETKTMPVKKFLSLWKQEKIKLPDCQRLYVWTKPMRSALLESVKVNAPISAIQLAQKIGEEDVHYLMDGQQRIASLQLLLNDPNISAADKKLIGNYVLDYSILYNVTEEQMQTMFRLHNSGMAVASVVKQRTKVDAEVRSVMLRMSANDFFKDPGFNATARKNHHHELITQNAMLAAAGVSVGAIKATNTRIRMNENKDAIMANINNAQTLLDALIDIYSEGILEVVRPRSLNSNFLSTLVYVMVKNPNIQRDEYVRLINYIFKDKKAIPEYSATTGSGAGGAENCLLRLNVICNLLDEKPYDNVDTNTVAYENFLADNERAELSTKDGEIFVPFTSFSDDEKKNLYDCMAKGFNADWDEIIRNKHNAIS